MVKTQEKPGVNSYVAVDIETTGLSWKTETIIEIGAVLVAEGQIQKNSAAWSIREGRWKKKRFHLLELPMR